MFERMQSPEDRYNQQLDTLFASYRDACGEPEVPADFMPKLWDRIEGGQHWTKQVWKWANGLVMAAAAASLFFVMLQMLPKQPALVYSATYLEALADHDEDEVLSDVAVARRPSDERQLPEKPSK